MYAFLIWLTIALPNGEQARFRFSSYNEFDPVACQKHKDAYAERLTAHAKRRIRFAVVRTESICELRITRPA